MTDYDLLTEQAKALTDGIESRIANLSNLSALIFDTIEDINWTGFYFLEGERLSLYPFQGKPACVYLPLDKGVCAKAFTEDRILNVPDVHAFAGHIACDSASVSEIVIPLHKNGITVGVIDIDSPIPNRFNVEDEKGLALLGAEIEKIL